ncbi:MAG: hypothetical protein AAF802_12330 [Planctomycetota bacterium]
MVTVKDEAGDPVADVEVISWPNVQWWNSGSQIYCRMLVKTVQFLQNRDMNACLDESYGRVFSATSDDNGIAKLMLPADGGTESLAVMDERVEQPIVDGRRWTRVKVKHGETTRVELVVIPKGTERLGKAK